jgi:hypothetical protein
VKYRQKKYINDRQGEIRTKAFETVIKSLLSLKTDRLSNKVNVTIQKAPIGPTITYVPPGNLWQKSILEFQRLQTKICTGLALCKAAKISVMYTWLSVLLLLIHRILQAANRSHTRCQSENAHSTEQGEGKRRKYALLKVGGGQTKHRAVTELACRSAQGVECDRPCTLFEIRTYLHRLHCKYLCV